ncbi:murein L,D-transpeptidase catalytic domain family protein [Taibaiella chishuiensis]|uniref:L,D-transpeptidase-like protein n=1 Tax=Taibaiella chishuiensis TaxID=1434707 RepID=A0A2P8D4R6_9BACT|nr:murein L,D-transpeptidase catalytic domain family protein [Taibaiella chishuiensis]PSK92205.1 L,D-transpeptidase-like protein [Taibaiella chishuiensis]
MQKIRVALLMIGMCASSFFVKAVKAEEGLVMNVRQKVNQKADEVYNLINFGKEEPLSRDVFRKAYLGYLNLRDADKLNKDEQIISICDFSLSANVKRLWVINLESHKVLFHTLVAHGQGTGDEFAMNFSNRDNSHQSSLGFYVTQETYSGDNGYSLKLNGMDRGYNDRAYDRAIVMHGAAYVCDSYIRSNQRLGRSWGCPAVPVALAGPIINTIKDGTCLYIYYPSKSYLNTSVWLNKTPQVSAEDLIKEEFLKSNKVQGAKPVAAAVAAPVTAQQAEPLKPQQPLYQGVQLALPQ